jgi:hypothetical protein
VLDGNNLAFVYLVDGCRSRGSHHDVLNEPIFVELSFCYVVFRRFRVMVSHVGWPFQGRGSRWKARMKLQ